MLNKTVRTGLTALLLVCLLCIAIPTAAGPRTAVFSVGSPLYFADGKWLVSDVRPFIDQNRCYVPLRAAAQALGVPASDITWGAGQVSLIKNGHRLVLHINRSDALLDGKRIETGAVSAVVPPGRVVVPVGVVGRLLNCEVHWDAKQRTATLVDAGTPGNSGQFTNAIKKDFSWSANGREYEWRVSIDQNLYETYKGLPRRHEVPGGIEEYNANFYVPYVTEEKNARLMDALAPKIVPGRSRLDAYERAQLVVSYVQEAIPYVSDPEGVEIPKYPVETLVDGGDCEDKAILAAAMLRSLGYQTLLLHFEDHAAIAVNVECPGGTYFEHAGTKYWFAEVSNKTWAIGELSDPGYRKAYLHPVPLP